MEIRSPCNSSSHTFPTVPAFPSVSTTALPINSDCAPQYSFKIFDARNFTDGIARPFLTEPSVLSKAAQRRRLFQRSALGIDGDCSSNSRSRQIGALRLPGSSGSSFRNARSLSPISCTIAWLCLGSMSMRLRIRSLVRVRKRQHWRARLPQLSRLRAQLGILNGIGDRRFWLSARALVFENSGPCSKEPLAIRDMRRVVIGERRSRVYKALTEAFVP